MKIRIYLVSVCVISVCVCSRGLKRAKLERSYNKRCVHETDYPSILSWELVAERAGVVKAFGPSDAPKLV